MLISYTMPTSGPTVTGDEFLNHVTREWCPIPPESIGQAIDGAIIRRPVVYDPSQVVAELDAAIRDLERTVAGFGLRFAAMRGAKIGPDADVLPAPAPAHCLDCGASARESDVGDTFACSNENCDRSSGYYPLEIWNDLNK